MTDGHPLTRCVASTHPDHLVPEVRIDFAELWQGADVPASGRGHNVWKGPYAGRPALAQSMWPAIQAMSSGARPDAIRSILACLRSFFRFLDAFEKTYGSPTTTIDEITDAHGILWIKPPADGGWESPNTTAYGCVKRIIYTVKADAGQPIWWPPTQPQKSRAESPTEQQARSLLHGLKREAQAIFKRWADADQLAMSGRDLTQRVGQGLRGISVSAADCQATFRSVSASSGTPVPTKEDVCRAVGLKGWPTYWPRTYTQVLEGAYPTSGDLAILAALFLARSGWNPATTLDLDVSNEDWATKQGSGRNVTWWIQSYKHRSASWQDTLSPERLTTGCYQIVRRLLERTASLRAHVALDVTSSRWPTIAARSPWIGVSPTGTSTTLFVLTRTQTINAAIRKIAEATNARIAEARARKSDEERAITDVDEVPLSFTSTDFRDAFASFTFLDSRYSWALTQWALGHKHLRSTRHYLRSRAWQRHTRGALTHFGTLLFDEIEVHRRVDPTVLRARVEGHVVSDQQLQGLKDLRRRTYVGMGCRDPTRPDEHIDPGRARAVSGNCVNSFRCASCSQGIVFDDSLPHLVKRVAELEWLQRHANLTEWSESSHAADLAVLRATLLQWPEIDVAEQVAHWRRRISDGSHRVVRFAGEN